MRLFIAEKPSMGMDIAKALGTPIRKQGYVEVGDDMVTWCVGHVIQSFDPQDYSPEYEKWRIDYLPLVPKHWCVKGNPKTAEQLSTIGRLLKRAKEVVHCGDAAREGQLIIDEVLDHFQYKGATKRLWLNEMNQAAIKKALLGMKNNAAYASLRDAALGRQRSDWLMGINLTRGYTCAWRQVGNSTVLHLGRVQTPTLCMIVARDIEIENFKPKNYFNLKALISVEKGEFFAKWIPPKDAPYLDEAGHVLNEHIVQGVADKVRGQQARIIACDTSPKKQSCPLPFSLGGLQKAVNKRLGLSPADTLEIAQSLYEKHKLTSYPRTDYSHLPESEHKDGPALIAAAKANLGTHWDFPGTPNFSLRSHAWNDAKIGDHHAIRPTAITGVDMTALSKNELIVYQMVVRQYLAQFYPDYRYESTVIDVESVAEQFKASGSVETDPGWKILFGLDSKEDDEEEESKLPVVSGGDLGSVANTQIEAKKTAAPPRFNGALIIDAMEKAHLFVSDERIKKLLKETGIGTPATRANIVEELVNRGYVSEVKEGKKSVYISTEKGRVLYSVAPIQLKSPDLTAYFEALLKDVEKGGRSLDSFMDQQQLFVTKLIERVKSGEVAKTMPLVDADSGPLQENVRGKPFTKAKEGEKACKCGRAMVARKGSTGEFWGCSGFPACRNTEKK